MPESSTETTETAYSPKHEGDDVLAVPLLSSSDQGEIAQEITTAQQIPRLLRLAGPIALQNCLYMLLGLISAAFIGRLGPTALASAVLAQGVMNVTGNSLLWGLACGLETLAGQAFGAQSYATIGIVLQRAILINVIAATLVILTIWLHMEPILLFLGQRPEIAANAAVYIHRVIPAFLTLAVDSCTSRFLMIQGVVLPQFLSVFLGAAVCIPYYLFFLHVLKWGIEGAAWAYSATMITMSCVDLGIVVYRESVQLKGKEEKCWHGWSKQAFSQWGAYLHIAIPSYLMISFEWWLFDVLSIMTGLLPNASIALATMGIAANVDSFSYMGALGIADAAVTLVSNTLGAQDAFAMRKIIKAAVGMVLTLQAFQCAVILLVRNQIGKVWSTDPEVLAYVARVAVPMAFAVLGDGTCAVLGGVLRGAGLQQLGVVCNLITYWGAGVPFAVLLAFKLKWGVVGIWVALATAVAVQAVVLMVITWRQDWVALANKAGERVDALAAASPGTQDRSTPTLSPSNSFKAPSLIATSAAAPFADTHNRPGMLSPRCSNQPQSHLHAAGSMSPQASGYGAPASGQSGGAPRAINGVNGGYVNGQGGAGSGCDSRHVADVEDAVVQRGDAQHV